MTAWYEAPYKGGPMIALPGFPRPMYPPDAASKGKTPSSQGKDVIAYKRIAWRLGRWPGPASGFDKAFSNNFSHGKSGNASETGLAGVQRQANIDDTGWIGEKTFNFLRSVRIPEGIPNGPGAAGDYAMDSYAQSLLVDAWDEFKGKEPAPPASTGTIRAAALKRAISQLGIKESPANSNQTPYTSWYGMVGPWCAMFTTWDYVLGASDVGKTSNSMRKGVTYAYVPYIVNDARSKRNGLSVTSSPIAGDLVCFDWGFDGTFDHVGIFESWAEGSASTFTAIEGNTSTSNDSDGGEVMRRTRRVPDQSTVFVRVAE